MSTAQPGPQLIAILVCDTIIRDQMTQKHTLVGLFNRIGAKRFPYRHGAMHVFVSLTDGHGEPEGELRLVCRQTNEPVVKIRGKLVFPNPLAVVEMTFGLFNAVFPRPGRYSFDLYCNDELVGSRPFDVVLQESPRKPPAQDA